MTGIDAVSADPQVFGARIRLGAALQGRISDIIVRLAAENPSSKRLVAGIFDEAAAVSTTAVADWIAGGDLNDARTAGARTINAFGRLAARHDVSLAHIIKRVLRWRDTLAEVLRDEADRLSSPGEALTQAVAMLNQSCDVTLVRLGDAFEAERQAIRLTLTQHQGLLTHQATHDPLTGLANRALILDRLEVALARATRLDSEIVAVLIDLDNFKYANDTYGHKLGDELLCAVAARFTGVVRETDTLGRLGGNEFIVITEWANGPGGHEVLAARIRESLKNPFVLGGPDCAPVTITASLGIARGSDCSPDELLRHADLALYGAKAAGSDQHVHFDADMATRTQRRSELEQELRTAVRDQQFYVAYQPIFELATMRTVAVEALARWRRPDGQQIGPDEFIPVLEDTGLILPMGRRILEQACRDGAHWHRLGHTVNISVNVSALQLESDDFMADIPLILATAGLPADALIVEITESALIKDPERGAQHLRNLKALGVKISIDDFGTGYSSLDQLRRLPVDTVKIDRSYVDRMLHDTQGEALIATLIGIAQTLSIHTLAEGIETHAQLAHLAAQSCEFGQGYLFARPLPANEIIELLNHVAPPGSWIAHELDPTSTN